ncbi:MAG: 30S ribosomal protein S11 [Parcubacteria group bacterium]|jgi:small subunit ribosomal protein S11|nr:30S ribosomal protein S11 [Parcubacteria group bacterium]|tara:strand:- start:15854 stop:16327 length:474 start_codon:yes stop_codon:yes gene_type:complete
MGQKKITNMSETPDQKKEEKKSAEGGEVKSIPKAKSKKKIKRQVSAGSAYIQATYNNTIITFTDAQGNALAQCSAGQVGFKGPKKSTPYAAGIIVAQAVEKVKPYGLKEVSVFVRGVGGGREAAIRSLNANGINVLGIKDVTPIPHNGCRPKKPRRV